MFILSISTEIQVLERPFEFQYYFHFQKLIHQARRAGCWLSEYKSSKMGYLLSTLKPFFHLRPVSVNVALQLNRITRTEHISVLSLQSLSPKVLPTSEEVVVVLLCHFSDEKSEASQSRGVCEPRQGQDLNPGSLDPTAPHSSPTHTPAPTIQQS